MQKVQKELQPEEMGTQACFLSLRIAGELNPTSAIGRTSSTRGRSCLSFWAPWWIIQPVRIIFGLVADCVWGKYFWILRRKPLTRSSALSLTEQVLMTISSASFQESVSW